MATGWTGAASRVTATSAIMASGAGQNPNGSQDEGRGHEREKKIRKEEANGGA